MPARHGSGRKNGRPLNVAPRLMQKAVTIRISMMLMTFSMHPKLLATFNEVPPLAEF
jgi:hypothetical protein